MRDLANECEVSITSVVNIENRTTEQPHRRTLEALRVRLEREGIEFGAHGWVRHRDDGSPSSGPFEDSSGEIVRVCSQALDHVERAGRVLRRVCGDEGSRAGR